MRPAAIVERDGGEGRLHHVRMRWRRRRRWPQGHGEPGPLDVHVVMVIHLCPGVVALVSSQMEPVLVPVTVRVEVHVALLLEGPDGLAALRVSRRGWLARQSSGKMLIHSHNGIGLLCRVLIEGDDFVALCGTVGHDGKKFS